MHKFTVKSVGYLLLGLLIIVGCATTANYQRELSHWRGQSIETLKQTWGEPDVEIKLANQHRVYLYSQKQIYVQPFYTYASSSAVSPPNVINVAGKTTYMKNYNEFFVPGRTVMRYCNTWFETNEEKIIINTRFQGNNCISNHWF